MPMVRVGTKTNIGHHKQIRTGGLYSARGLLHGPVFRPGAGTLVVLLSGQAKQKNGGNPQLVHLLGFGHHAVRGQVKAPGHGSDGRFAVLSRFNEERIYQIV